MTSYPNIYGHEKQEEAGLEVHQFYPLVEVGCYKHLKFFLCAMYTPICQDNYEKPVMPCREVCLEARKNCEPLMRQYNFKWPPTLSCDSLPKISEQQATGDICAAPPDTQENEVKYEDKSPSFPSYPIDNNIYPVVGIDVIDYQCECRCVKPFHVAVERDYKVLNVSKCAYSCYSTALRTQNDRHFINTWIAVWSGICLALSVFTILTFIIELERFPYPERPIFFLALCQMMVSIGFLVRVFNGQENVACDGNLLKSGVHGSDLCMLVFVLIYFFGMAASAWWVILSLSWVLAAVPHWSTEWIAKYSTYFHLFSWLVPGIQTAGVILFNAVDGDPISGICYVGNTDVGNLFSFVIVPLLTYFVVGVCFLSVGFLNLWGIRSNLKKTHPGVDKTSKLTQLMSKIGIFSVLYTVPAIFVILVLFYEQHYRPLVEQSQLCPCARKVEVNRDTITLLALIKTASMLVVGWTSGVWIISGKTLQSWRRAICCCFGSSNTIPYTEHTHTLTRQYHLVGSSPPHKYQPADIIYAQRECLSPLVYGGGTLRHCQAMHTPILPEKV
uniref:Uncharacterized protein n=1 Tax=Acrobeloides nanus TaxID=290746 RepID=A0A914DBR6_9BILA